MKFRTVVETNHVGLTLNLRHRVLLMGSCFAENVGRRLVDSKFNCRVNPFGVLYNPESIGTWLRYAVREKVSPSDFPLLQTDEGWRCWLSDSSFLAQSEEECRDRLWQSLQEVRHDLLHGDVLILTLGTNRCYRLCSTGMVVGNCHKQSSSLFEEWNMSVGETIDALECALVSVWKHNPLLRVVFTVSPYRYAKYGFHGSQLGKATLLLAVHDICRRHPEKCTYFPAYEIVLDELRDYRFYAEDMLHPSAQAVDYIWERFCDVCVDDDSKAFIKKWMRIRESLQHRPLHPESEAYRKFLNTLAKQLDDLQTQCTDVDFSVEREDVKSRIESLERK